MAAILDFRLYRCLTKLTQDFCLVHTQIKSNQSISHFGHPIPTERHPSLHYRIISYDSYRQWTHNRYAGVYSITSYNDLCISVDYVTFLCQRCSCDALPFADDHFSDIPVITTPSNIENIESNEFNCLL